MAFLIPENIPSRNDVPERLQIVARAFRDFGADEITVWLEGEGDEPYLLVLDPSRGVLLIDAPPIKGGIGRSLFQPRSTQVSLSQVVEDRWKQLSQSMGRENRLPDLPVRSVVAFPTLSAAATDRVASHLSQKDRLTQEDLEEGKLERALDVIFGEGARKIDERQERVTRGIINPEIIISGSGEDPRGQLVFVEPEIAAEDVIRVLDREQERLARHLGGGYRVIRGVAGSGKTLVLTHRARFLAERHPNWRILLTCFNLTLAKALEKAVEDTPNVTVATIDSFVRRINGRLPPKDGWDAARVAAAERLLSGRVTVDRFDVVLVDETQDFDSAQLDIAYGLLADGREEFVVAIDGAQNIYRRRGRWNPPGMTARGRTHLLRVNYRNTKEILEFAMKFLTGTLGGDLDESMLDDPDFVVPPEATRRRGPRPRVLSARDRRGEVDAAADTVQRMLEEGVPPDSIAVIYGSPTTQRGLYGAFRSRNLPYFWTAMNRHTKQQFMSIRDVVRSSTIQSMKGLEFSRVVICGANEVRAPDDDPESVKRLLYVAMTRAMDELVITTSGQGPIPEALARAG